MPDGELVGSTAAELSAARAIGLPFIGLGPDETTRRRLRAAYDGVQLVTSLSPLLTAARKR
ncbi:hypothetical protein [Streptomyces blattellae]|uniref:hypothetical protein n=1 Tax=Streptomyces blattellae TaxID=2569855 RepID=UPI0012B8A0A9|nr:hypothetical protein [Streptomyces blattellae]